MAQFSIKTKNQSVRDITMTLDCHSMKNILHQDRRLFASVPQWQV